MKPKLQNLFQELKEAALAGNAHKLEELTSELASKFEDSPEALLPSLEKAIDAQDQALVLSLSQRITDHMKCDPVRYPETLISLLLGAANNFDREEVENLCSKLHTHLRSSNEAYPIDSLLKILRILRCKKYFSLTRSTADLLLQTQPYHPTIQRRYAQSLIEEGELSAACTVLEDLLLRLSLIHI